MIKVNKKSLQRALRKSKLPKYLEKSLEEDVIECLRDSGITEGEFEIRPGKINYDFEVDKNGRKRIVRKR